MRCTARYRGFESHRFRQLHPLKFQRFRGIFCASAAGYTGYNIFNIDCQPGIYDLISTLFSVCTVINIIPICGFSFIIHMTNYREILRLSALGLSQSDIARSCNASKRTVNNVLRAAKRENISWPLDNDQTNAVLAGQLYPSAERSETL